MRTPGKKRNDYDVAEKIFFAENVFQTAPLDNARRIMEAEGITNTEEFEIYISKEEVAGCDWIKFLVDRGYFF